MVRIFVVFCLEFLFFIIELEVWLLLVWSFGVVSAELLLMG